MIPMSNNYGIDLEPLLDKYHPDSIAGQTIQAVANINQTNNDRINKVQKHVLRFEEGSVLEFYNVSGPIISRFAKTGEQFHPWVISTKTYIVKELRRDLGVTSEALDKFAKDNDYDSYEAANEYIDSFTGYHKGDGLDSESMEIGLISSEYAAYWVGNVGFISSFGWIENFDKTLSEHFPDQ